MKDKTMSQDFGMPHTGWNRESKQTARGWLLTALHFENPDVNAWLALFMLAIVVVGRAMAADMLLSL